MKRDKDITSKRKVAEIKNRWPSMNILVKSLLLLGMSSSFTVADTVYKIVDEEGNVSYSQSPPQDPETAFEIDIDAPPTQQQRDAAMQRHERNKQAAGIMDENRKAREKMIAKENRLRHESKHQYPGTTPPRNGGNDYGYHDSYPYYPPYRWRPPYWPGYRPDHRPGRKPDHRHDHRPGHRPDQRPDHRPGRRHDYRLRHRPSPYSRGNLPLPETSFRFPGS